MRDTNKLLNSPEVLAQHITWEKILTVLLKSIQTRIEERDRPRETVVGSKKRMKPRD